ncbi:MAG TPA: L-seryl-tRNA(Sec) selenium transferase [Acidimicrobiales bacterium]|nr:L-seryl-tRNA(Sec) selenium transferase [Acidimicrobiales bacterium]
MQSRPPSVDRLARQLAPTGLPHAIRVNVARQAIAAATDAGDIDSVSELAAEEAANVAQRLLQPVVNATGVLLHTNLGRAPLAVVHPARYSNVEFDLVAGARGDRSAHAAELIAKACGAEAALVVNNGAAAILLAITTLAAGREVVVSRGELVEIGGGFRVPEVIATSGARLVEVGTTNKTRYRDYNRAIHAETALLLKVHTSNYRITGFTESTGVDELASSGLPVAVDLGSGLLDSSCPWLTSGPPPWLADEPAVRQTLAAGAALVTFSGDKLLGGPQAGVIAGAKDLVDACRRHPLARALRPGGLVLDALQGVALAYLRRDVSETIPLWQMATAPLPELRRRADRLGVGKVVDCTSVVGGGTLPGVGIPSAGIAMEGDVTPALRRSSPPIVARVEDGRTICDLRTVFPEQDSILTKALDQ